MLFSGKKIAYFSIAIASLISHNAHADYWRITLKAKEQQRYFDELQYIFKINSYDLQKTSDRERDIHARENWAKVVSVPATDNVADSFFLEDAKQERLPFRQLVSTWSDLGEGFPSQCGTFRYKLTLADGSSKNGFTTRSGILPTLFTEIGGVRHEMRRIVGTALAIGGSRADNIVPKASNVPGLQAYDVIDNATFVYDKQYFSICRSLIEPASGKLLEPAWWPQNVPYIEFLSDAKGQPIYEAALKSRLQGVVQEQDIARVLAFKNVLQDQEYAQLFLETRNYWHAKYRSNTQDINKDDASHAFLTQLAGKVPLQQATRWDEVDFDNLAPKAKKLLDTRATRETARIVAWRKKLKVGSDTFCGPVIEVRNPMYKIALNAQLQGFNSEAWVKSGDMFPAEYGCQNANGRLSPLNERGAM